MKFFLYSIFGIFAMAIIAEANQSKRASDPNDALKESALTRALSHHLKDLIDKSTPNIQVLVEKEVNAPQRVESVLAHIQDTIRAQGTARKVISQEEKRLKPIPTIPINSVDKKALYPIRELPKEETFYTAEGKKLIPINRLNKKVLYSIPKLPKSENFFGAIKNK